MHRMIKNVFFILDWTIYIKLTQLLSFVEEISLDSIWNAQVYIDDVSDKHINDIALLGIELGLQFS